MMDLGDRAENSIIDFLWSTNTTVGASATRTVDGEVRVYKANSTTQTTTGITDDEDFDVLTGVHHCRIDTSDAFYATGNDYSVVLQGATIDGKVVNGVIAQFSIENRFVGSLVLGSAGIPTPAESFNMTTGSVASGDYTDTASLNATYHQLQDVGGVLKGYYQFDVGANGVPIEATIAGRLNSADDSLNINAWNWGNSSWEFRKTLTGQDGSVDIETVVKFFAQHVGTGANLGKVRLEFQATGLTSANLYIDELFISYTVVAISAGYNGFVWLDTVNGTSGTVSDYNGTSDRPVNNLADAITIAGNKNLTRIMVANGSSITFVQSMDNFSLIGERWTLALGGQSCSNTVIEGTNVSGTCTGANPPCFRNCRMGTVTLPPCDIINSGLQTTITLGSAGDYHFIGCNSMVAGQGTPIINFGAAIGNTNLNMRRVSSGIELQNMGQAGTDVASLEGWGQYIINVNCIGGNLSVRGNFKATDNSGGAVTVDVEAQVNKTQITDANWDGIRSGHNIAGSFGETNQNAVPSEDIEDYKADVSGLSTSAQISRLLGLSKENVYEYTRVYTGGKLTSVKVDLYDSKANATVHNGTGRIAQYTYTLTYSGDEITSMLCVRDS